MIFRLTISNERVFGCQVFCRLSLPLHRGGIVDYQKRNELRSDGNKIHLFGFLILTDVFMKRMEMENKNNNLVDIDDVSCLLAAIPIFTLCDVVCGGRCCAIQGFSDKPEVQCQRKIKKFLLEYIGEAHDG